VPKWVKARVLDALQAHSDAAGSLVFTDVPVTAENWRGWGEGTSRRYATVSLQGLDRVGVMRFKESEFVAALGESSAVSVVLAWGFLDRPGFGELTTRQAFFSRSWMDDGSVGLAALCAEGEDGGNTADVFRGAGAAIEQVLVPRNGPKKSGRSGPPAGRNDPWESPRSFEDWLLHDLWESEGRRGWWLAEVPVGFKPEIGIKDSGSRRLDALVIEGHGPRTHRGGKGIEDLLALDSFDATVIEAKGHLGHNVVGQLLSGREMLRTSFPAAGSLQMIACVAEDGDPAMRWFCQEHDIRVELVERRNRTL
jgi:hypothetical protein